MFCKKNIFISHSSENKEIAEQLCSFMMRLGVKEKDIFCSSIIGRGVGNGEKLNESICKAINQSKLLIYILSYDFLRSSYCIEELGAGWYLSQREKTTCFYLILPDIELSELKGFVNSKIDKFSFVDFEHRDELGMFAVDVAKKMNLKTPQHQVIVNACKNFFSATDPLLNEMKQLCRRKKEEIENKDAELDHLKRQLQGKEEIIKNMQKTNETNFKKAEEEKRLVKYRTIIRCFRLLGLCEGITRQQFLSLRKEFWFNMVHEYEQLECEFGAADANIQMLLANIYSFDGALDQAYQRTVKYIELERTNIYPLYFKNITLEESNTADEIIDILVKKIETTPRGVVYDSYQETLNYLLERKKKIVSGENKKTE